MKRLFFSLAALASFGFAFGQGAMDALNYTQTDIRGTARYTARAGAMGTFGDASAIVDNPATLGTYRKGDLNITPGVAWVNTNSGGYTDFSLGGTLDNFAFVGSFLTDKEYGVVAHNFGINYNRLRNYRNNISTYIRNSPSSLTDFVEKRSDPFRDLFKDGNLITKDNVSILDDNEIVNKQYISEKRGTIDEWDFSYATNISNIFYIGATIGVQSLDYRYNSTYSEDFIDRGGTSGFDLKNWLETSGIGANLKIGAMVRPVEFLRVGASFTTPTIYDMEDRFKELLDSSEAESLLGGQEWGVYDYTLTTPYKVMGSLGLEFGQIAAIGINYEMKDYAIAKFGRNDYYDTNLNIKEYFKKTHTLKVGGEFRLGEAFGLRAGYAVTTPPVKQAVEKYKQDVVVVGTTPAYAIPHHSSFYSLGFGYSEKHFYCDLAYSLNVQNENLYLYPNAGKGIYEAEAIKTQTFASNIVATLGFRF